MPTPSNGFFFSAADIQRLKQTSKDAHQLLEKQEKQRLSSKFDQQDNVVASIVGAIENAAQAGQFSITLNCKEYLKSALDDAKLRHQLTEDGLLVTYRGDRELIVSWH